MRPGVSYLSAAIFAGMLALFAPLQAKAGPAVDQTILAPLSQSAGLVQAGYYGGGDYERDEKRYDDDGYDGGHGGGDHYGAEPKHDYDDGGHKNGCCSGYGHSDGYGYDHYRKRYPDYHDEGCYKKKWVCESSVPRCFKQRECVWYYGKEYCRYVHRCVGGGDNYCKWVSVHSYNCGGY